MKNISNKKIIILKDNRSLILSPSDLQSFKICYEKHWHSIELNMSYSNNNFLYTIKELNPTQYCHPDLLSEINEYLFPKLLDFNNNKEMVLDLTKLDEDPILLGIIKNHIL